MIEELPLHGLPPRIINMIRGEISAALEGLNNLLTSEDSRTLVAVTVLLEEVLPEFDGNGRKPWRAAPWLDCASQLLQRSHITDTGKAREHISAARDLLARD